MSKAKKHLSVQVSTSGSGFEVINMGSFVMIKSLDITPVQVLVSSNGKQRIKFAERVTYTIRNGYYWFGKKLITKIKSKKS